MSQMTDKLDEIIVRHKEWLSYNEADSSSEPVKNQRAMPRGIKANLSEALLPNVELLDRDLSGANIKKAVLKEATLTRCKLRAADLSGANLRGANLNLCQLNDANLEGADLTGASLSWANLQFAKLSGANLTDANISYCIGDGRFIKNLHPGSDRTWWTTYTATHMAIGCHVYPIERWLLFTDDEIKIIEPDALWKWVTHKTLLFELLTHFPAEEFTKS